MQAQTEARGRRPSGQRAAGSLRGAAGPKGALGPPGTAVPAVPGDAVRSCQWVGPGSNFALKIGAAEQLRAGRAGAPAVQHLSVGIKICKAEASAQPPPQPLCSAWCVIGVNCLIAIIVTVWGSGFQPDGTQRGLQAAGPASHPWAPV